MSATAAGGADPTPGRLRAVDLLTLAYFTINTLLLLHPNRPANWPALLGVHALYLVGVPLLARFGARHRLAALLRDWYPFLGLPFLYYELRYLNQVLTTGFFDHLVLRWERALFHGLPSITLRQWLAWKPLGEAVHFGYFWYYFLVPSLFFPLWFTGRRREFRIATAVVLGTYYFCYLWFVFFPVTGPYWQFARPVPATEGWFFPQLNNRIIGAGSSRGAAFPSSHVAAAVVILGLALRYHPPVGRALLLPVTLLCVGTVYGGFHYGVDALAGLAVGVLAAWLGPGLVARADDRRRKGDRP